MERSLRQVAGVAQRLLDRVAVVTGAGEGIGYACAECLGAEGAKVVVADIDMGSASRAVERLRGQGITAAAVACDVSQKAQVERLMAHAVALYAAVDIFVANAGILRAAPFLEMEEADFDDVIATNLKGTFLCNQAAARQMVKQGRGTIINMSSVNSVVGIPFAAGYNASKSGVSSLTRDLALSLAPHGIRVNAIGPGSIRTQMMQTVAGDKAAMHRILSRTPLGRLGEPAEVGQVCAFLASDAASYITGQTLICDGGRLAMNYTCPVPEDA